jgi:signal transduction histidine kinase
MALWELETVRNDLSSRGEGSAARALGAVSDALDEVRESEVRAVAHALYPMAADLDLETALRALADRVPTSVRLEIQYAGGAGELVAGSALAPADRVTLFSIVEEGVTNAVKHGRAATIRVALDAEPEARRGRTAVRITVEDDGTGLDGVTVELSGLGRIRARVRGRGGELTLGPSPTGGARLEARLPVGLPRDDADAPR